MSSFRSVSDKKLKSAYFELPYGTDPDVVTDVHNDAPENSYKTSTIIHEPYYAVYFKSQSTSGYKNGFTDIFHYTIPYTLLQTMSVVRVLAYSEEYDLVSFNTF